MQNKKAGFSLAGVMIAMVLIAILATVLIPDLRNAITGGKESVAYEQAAKFQGCLDVWIAEQSSLTAAARAFQAGPSNTLVPRDLNALVDAVNAQNETTNDKFEVVDGKIVTQAMKNLNAYIEVTWPQPFRNNHPRANLTIPTE